MFFSGFCDEAAKDIEGQIKAQKAIGGFEYVELRMVDGVQFASVDEATFETIAGKLNAASLKISCYGSAIANWARDIDGDFKIDVDDLKRIAPRMRKTGTPIVRVMSWANRNKVPEAQWHTESVRRMKELCKIASNEGILIGHENCDGWGGHTIQNTVTLLAEVDSPALKLIFDTGNPAHHNQDAWEFYKTVRKDIAYVHIKDYKVVAGQEKPQACFAGDGLGRVKDIVRDLIKTGYTGGYSIEPHITAAIHEGKIAAEHYSAFDTYVEYGRKFKALVDGVVKS
ncbi:MAG: sugar phosphate isomerase/epimerase family protein [Planctomycetota bacterium]